MTMRRVRIVGTALLMCALLTVVASGAFAARHRIVIETEHYNAIKPSAKVVADTTASGGKYTTYPLKRPHATTENPAVKGDGGYVLFKVKIPEQGNYRVWLRRWYFDGCGNSFFLVVDSKPPQKIEGATYKTWKWQKAQQTYALTAGTHVFKVQNREDGARADEILITNDMRFIPTRAMAETPQYRVTE